MQRLLNLRDRVGVQEQVADAVGMRPGSVGFRGNLDRVPALAGSKLDLVVLYAIGNTRENVHELHFSTRQSRHPSYYRREEFNAGAMSCLVAMKSHEAGFSEPGLYLLISGCNRRPGSRRGGSGLDDPNGSNLGSAE
jgi:hypothetical protein